MLTSTVSIDIHFSRDNVYFIKIVIKQTYFSYFTKLVIPVDTLDFVTNLCMKVSYPEAFLQSVLSGPQCLKDAVKLQRISFFCNIDPCITNFLEILHVNPDSEARLSRVV